MTVNVTDWSTTPASNTTVGGISIAENCTPANLNDAARAIMAGVRSAYDAQATVNATIAGAMPAAGGAFSGTQPIYTGRGAYHHNSSQGLTSGQWFVQAAGGSPPAMQPGDWLAEY
jgi:hypothetical protein